MDRPARVRTSLVDDMARAVIRHQLTDYDRLMAAHGLARTEARSAVEREVDDWLAAWGDPGAVTDRLKAGGGRGQR